MDRKSHPSDVTGDERAFLAPCLALMTEEAPQCRHALCEVLNGLRVIVRTGMQRRMTPNDLLPWYTVYQQVER